MGDTEGTFRITYTQLGKDGIATPITLSFGAVTSIKPSITKSVSTIPLVSMGADRAFQLETGNTKEYNISFSRVNPTDYDNSSSDSTLWSNAYWYEQVTKLADRWQMKTDGCRITYLPAVTNPYVPSIDTNGYIKMLTRTYNSRFNELITGTIQIIVGTMYVLSSPTNKSITSIEQEKYRTILLDPGLATSYTKYNLKPVVFILDNNDRHIIGPELPSAWRKFASEEKYRLNRWFADGIHYSINQTGLLPQASNVPTVLTAEWVSTS